MRRSLVMVAWVLLGHACVHAKDIPESDAETSMRHEAAVKEISNLGGTYVAADPRKGRPYHQLDLKDWKGVTEDFELLEELVRVDTLVLPSSANDEVLDDLQLPYLHDVHFWYCKVTHTGLNRFLKRHLQIEQLTLTGLRRVDADELSVLATMKKLVVFKLSSGTVISDVGIQQLPLSLTALMVSCPQDQLSEEGIKHIGKMKHLTSLNYPGVVTDVGLQQLASLAQLKSLELNDSKITDKGLVVIGAFSSLRSLLLRKSHVTNVGLRQLEGLKRLKVLDVRGTKCTNVGIEKLRKALGRKEAEVFFVAEDPSF